MALEKIDGAIGTQYTYAALLQPGNEEPEKLVEAWIKRAELLAAQNKPDLVSNNYSKVSNFLVQAYNIIQKYPGCVTQEK